MKDDRGRGPVKTEYVHALGLAAFCFASCEWQVVWCCEKIRSGSLNTIVGEKMTAGEIAEYFKKCHPKHAEVPRVSSPVQSPMRTVRRRGTPVRLNHAVGAVGP